MAHSVCHMEGAARPSRLGRSASLAVAATVLALVALAAAGNEVHAGSRSQGRSLPLTLAIPSMTSPRGTQQLVQALNELVARSPMTLTAAIEQLVQQSGASAGVSLVEIGGAIPFEWSFNGDAVFTAASTYKLAVLMMEAQNIASGKTSAGGSVCFQDADYEAGWHPGWSRGSQRGRTQDGHAGPDRQRRRFGAVGAEWPLCAERHDRRSRRQRGLGPHRIHRVHRLELRISAGRLAADFQHQSNAVSDAPDDDARKRHLEPGRPPRAQREERL